MKHPGSPHERVVPPVYRHQFDAACYRQFSWKERLQILAGYNAVVSVKCQFAHSVGQFSPPEFSLRTTKELLQKPPV